MTHDLTCQFDSKYCSMCKLQAEARADEREKIAMRIEAAWKNLHVMHTIISAIHGQNTEHVYEKVNGGKEHA